MTPTPEEGALAPGRGRLLPTVVLAAVAGSGAGCQPPDLMDLSANLTNGDGVAEVVLLPADDDRPWPSDPWTYVGHAIRGDTLDLEVRYGGGCRHHRFALLTDAAFMESHPVQVGATLAHDADGDLCRALVTRVLRFDLAPLRRRYREAYGEGSATLVIVLAGQRLEYHF